MKQARPLAAAELPVGARPHGKAPLHEFERRAPPTGRGERAKVADLAFSLLHPTHQAVAWPSRSKVELEMEKARVVHQLHVVAWPVLLDQRVFENKCFTVGLNHHRIDFGCRTNQESNHQSFVLPGDVLPDPCPNIARLSHIQHRPRRSLNRYTPGERGRRAARAARSLSSSGGVGGMASTYPTMPNQPPS